MIKEIDALMEHWGEQRRRHGLGAGIGSQMGSIMDWKGCAPRGTPGSRILIGGSGIDFIGGEIEAVIAELDRSDATGKTLAKLTYGKYFHQISRREQMREAGISEGADRTYRNWVHKLHLAVQSRLHERLIGRREQGNFQ